MSANGLRFKKARLLIDDAKSIARGWYFNFTRTKLPLDKDTKGWSTISEFVTPIKRRVSLGLENGKRAHNMRLCCGLIDRIVLQPREVFSFQKVVGDATEARGFKGGPMLINGNMASSIGGGLCQISSTLFGAALIAGLEILERYNHSVDFWGDERFVDLGRDATYAHGLKDLKFRNAHPHPVLIAMEVLDERAVRARVLSPEPLKSPPRLVTRVLRRIEPPVAANRDGQRVKEIAGWEVLTRRFIDSMGGLKTTYEATDIYKPISVLEMPDEA